MIIGSLRCQIQIGSGAFVISRVSGGVPPAYLSVGDARHTSPVYAATDEPENVRAVSTPLANAVTPSTTRSTEATPVRPFHVAQIPTTSKTYSGLRIRKSNAMF